MTLHVYLSGEIHTEWRDEIKTGTAAKNLDVVFSSAHTNHEQSDAAGDVLGEQPDSFWRDHQSAKINTIHSRTQIGQSDLAIIRFGQQYKQWNAAFDAGYCAAMNIPYITLHDDNLIHPLKEVNAAAMGRATTPAQVVDVIEYLCKAG